MRTIAGFRIFSTGSRTALAVALGTLTAPAVLAQAPETQTQANPAPAEDRAAAQAGAVNDPGTGNQPGDGGVEEIVVTAQFREQNLQDTPLAITAVSGAMLEARSQTNISQVANNAPSVTLKPQGAAFGPSLGANIRGVGQFDFNPALEPGVGLYVDDVYYATLTGSILDLLDVERVEILRGPQGTLAGKNSIGGAVKVYSKRPEGSNSGYASVAYGKRDRIDLRGSFDFALGETLAARVSGVSKKQDGYVKRLDFGCVYPAGTSPLNPAGGIAPVAGQSNDCVLAKEGEVDYQAIRGQLRWQPNDDIDINIIGDYTIDDRVTAGTVLLQRNFPNGAQATPMFPAVLNPSPVPGQNFSNPSPPRDINPFGVAIPYDARFVCGRYCNFSTYQSLADTQPAGGPFPTLPTNVVNGRTKFEGFGFSGQLEWKLSDALQLVSITAYRDYDTAFTNDDDVSPLAHSLGGGNLSFHSFSQELRLNGSLFDDKVEYTLGGFYMDQKSLYATFQDLRYAGLFFLGGDPVDADTKAAFLHLSWRPIDALTLTGGLRYTDESKTYTYARLNPLTGGPLPANSPVAALNGVSGTYDGPQSTRFDYRLNAQYEVTDDISIYGQVSTGFKGGGINPRPFFVQQVLPFGPEKLTSYEAGFKSDLFDRMLRVNVAAYYSKFKDIQGSLSNCTAQAGVGFGVPCALIAPIGTADIKGFEIETSIRPTAGFLIDAALSHIDFEYKTLDPAAGGPLRPNGPQFGNVPTFTPKWKWSVGAQYAIGLGDAGSLTPRFDAAFQDDVFTNPTNRPTNKIDDYVLANARLTWANANRDLEISAEVTNLFDKYYFLTIFDLTIAGAGVSSGQPGRPREWAVTVKKKF